MTAITLRGEQERLHGWDMARIDAMAGSIVAAHPGWWTEGTWDDHKEAARAGITEALLTASGEPSPADLYLAGQKTLRKWVNDESRYHGRRAVRKFTAYWDWCAGHAPSPEQDVIDRMATAQDAQRAMRLVRGLPRRQREAILAFAEHGTYEAAAASMSLGTSTFKSHLHRARAMVTALWDSPAAGRQDGRCPDCGYVLSAPGHKVTCGGAS